METKNNIALKLKTNNLSLSKLLIGFDGFVDEIIHVVDKRQDSTHYTRVKTISDFANKIEKASGLSSNIEFLPKAVKMGGNGPILSNALAQHQAKITYIGTLGYPDIHPVFKPLSERLKLITIEKYGNTQAVEFNDGKLIIGKMNTLVNVDYALLTDIVSEDRLIHILDSVDGFSMVNWSMFPHMTDIWKNIIANILPKLKIKAIKPYLFLDIADPEKRESQDIIEALHLLTFFKNHFQVAIGLNKKEAYDLSVTLGLFTVDEIKHKSLKDINIALYDHLKLDYVIIHPVDCSSLVYKGIYYEAQGPYIKEPKLTTGAGDNFNAGLIAGLLYGLEPEESLVLGMATSGYYVRHAESPNPKQLIEFLEDWKNNTL